MNVLFVTYGMPYPPHGGAHTRDFYLMRALAQKHQVTCLCLFENPNEIVLIPWLEKYGIAACGFPEIKTNPVQKTRGLVQHLAARRPAATFPMWNRSLATAIGAVCSKNTIDVIQCEHSFLSSYLDAVPRSFRGKTVLDLHNIGGVQYARMARLPAEPRERAGAWLKARAMQDWEARHAGRFDHVVTVSENDAAWLRAHNSALRVTVIENGVDTDSIVPLAENGAPVSVLFVGTLGYAPNVDGLQWFCGDILPELQKMFHELELRIVGHAPNAQVRALGNLPGVALCADAPDLKPYYENAGVVIVPLRAGGGTRVKILEAMAYGRAIVSTSVGCEGLDVRDGEHLAIADTAGEFVERVTFLLKHHAERERLARNGRHLVETRYNWNALGAKLLKMYDEPRTA